mmetsp:Transcript_88468/g.273888  ORF Transcript_88468/g.273888 Transcript_88468/m.273888 type:complete len:210 (-) Transcript_88468:20-649(-)
MAAATPSSETAGAAPATAPGEERAASNGVESQPSAGDSEGSSSQSGVRFVPYKDETDMPGIVELIEKDLSEPYSIFTYRYFINNWPELCFLTMRDGSCVGAIVCKLDVHTSRNTHRGYIAMLAVEKSLRGNGIGSKLVGLCLEKMREMGADECVLETEVTNKGALGLYRSMGFVKEKRLHKYYLNGNDAFRLKFLFKLPDGFDRGEGCL